MLTESGPDYYAVLQVTPEAALPAIKRAYHRLMFDLGAHPDRGGDHLRATLINEAWAVLRDPVARRAYDLLHLAPPLPAEAIVESRIEARPAELDDAQWAELQRLGELRTVAYQRAGERACTCQRCGRDWITRSFYGMPNRCPSCRRPDWATRRFACCFVCHQGFLVRDMDRPINDVRANCPGCNADDWSLRPVVLRCRACDTPNRVRRVALAKAYCGRCRYALGDHPGIDESVRRWGRSWLHRGYALLDRLLMRRFGSL